MLGGRRDAAQVDLQERVGRERVARRREDRLVDPEDPPAGTSAPLSFFTRTMTGFGVGAPRARRRAPASAACTQRAASSMSFQSRAGISSFWPGATR
jgi:hypothetical protein